MMPGRTAISKKEVVKIEQDELGIDFYLADGTGIRMERRCHNISRFNHSHADPDRPTGG